MALAVAWCAWSSIRPSAPGGRAAGRRAVAAGAGAGLPDGAAEVARGGVVVVGLPPLALHLVCTADAELATVVVVELRHLAVGARRPSGAACSWCCGPGVGRVHDRAGSGVLCLVVAELTTVLAHRHQAAEVLAMALAVAWCAWSSIRPSALGGRAAGRRAVAAGAGAGLPDGAAEVACGDQAATAGAAPGRRSWRRAAPDRVAAAADRRPPGGRAAGQAVLPAAGAGLWRPSWWPWCWPWRGVVCVVERRAVEPLALALACPSGLLWWPALACGGQASSAGAVVCTAGAELATVVVVELRHLAIGARRPSYRPGGAACSWCCGPGGSRARDRAGPLAHRRQTAELLAMALAVAWCAWSSIRPSAPGGRAAGRRAVAAGAGLPDGAAEVARGGVVVVRLPPLALHPACTAGAELATVVVVELRHLAVGARRPSGAAFRWCCGPGGGRAHGRVGSGVLRLVVAELTDVLAVACCAWWWPSSRTCWPVAPSAPGGRAHDRAGPLAHRHQAAELLAVTWRGVRGRGAGRRRLAAERRAVEPLSLVLACPSGLLRWPALACGDQAATAGVVVCTAGAELATVVVVELQHLAVGAGRPNCRPGGTACSWCSGPGGGRAHDRAGSGVLRLMAAELTDVLAVACCA